MALELRWRLKYGDYGDYGSEKGWWICDVRRTPNNSGGSVPVQTRRPPVCSTTTFLFLGLILSGHGQTPTHFVLLWYKYGVVNINLRYLSAESLFLHRVVLGTGRLTIARAMN